MSKIALSPNASGSGTVTITAPNTNTNRTIALPDVAGNVVTTGDTGTVATGMIADSLNTPCFQATFSSPLNNISNNAEGTSNTIP